MALCRGAGRCYGVFVRVGSGAFCGSFLGGSKSGMDLKPLGNHLESEFVGNCLSVPLHEGGIDLVDLVVIDTKDLGLEGVGLPVGHVVFVVLADVDLSNQAALNKDRKRAVNGSSGDGRIDRSRLREKVFGGVVGVSVIGRLEDGMALVRYPEPSAREVVPEGFPRV